MTDPFADFETQTTSESPKAEETKTVTTAPVGDGKVVVTLKGGAGYDSPWIVIHAADVADAHAQMNDPQLKELMDIVKRAGSHFGGGSKPAQAAPQQQSKPPQQQAPSGETRTCEHGEMTFKSGVSKTGKPWKAFFCPAPKGSAQCDPQWVK